MYKVLIDGTLFCDSRIEELALINPVVTNKVNSAGAFTFTVPTTHPKANLIHRRSSVVSVYYENDTAPMFQGVVTDEKIDFIGQKTYNCEGELTYLNDSIQRQIEYTHLTVRQMLEALINSHNAQVESSKRFTVGMVTAGSGYISAVTNFESTMQCVQSLLVDEFGGYVRVRYADNTKYIDYLDDSPHTSNQIISLGVNLIDYESNIDSTEIVTSIIPLGADLEEQAIEGVNARVDIKSVNGGIDYLYTQSAVDAYGWITAVETWDNIKDPATLKAKGEAYLAESQFENVVITCKAVDLGLIDDNVERFKVLDKIRIKSAIHGMDKYFVLSEQVLNLNEPEKDTITLGKEEKTSLSAQTNSNNQRILQKIEQMPTTAFMQSAIDNATALITGAEGGYVVITRNSDGQPIELKIQDALNNPSKIWRWNINGLGYSNDGGQNYGLAMTMDGSIVANWIKSGIITGIEMNNGNGTFHVDANGNLTANSLTSTHATITGGSINIDSDSGTRDIIRLNYSGSSGSQTVDMTPSGFTQTYAISGTTYNECVLSSTGVDIRDVHNNTESSMTSDFVTTPEIRTDVLKIAGSSILDIIANASVSYANSAGSTTYAQRASYADMCDNVASSPSHTPNTFIYSSTNEIMRIPSGSSRRWKHDIKPVEDEELNPHKLYELPVVQFVYNEDFIKDSRTQIGFIAEDIEEIYPIACERDDDDGSAINWLERNIIPPMLALIQEQKKMIDDLTKRVETLEKGENNA